MMFKYMNKEKSADENSLILRKKEEYKEQNEENDTNKIRYKKRLNNELKKKLSTILNLYTNPNKINIHNKIYASDMDKVNLDNDKVIYINNNYFFNVDKDNYFENCDGKCPRNSMKYNFKKLDLQFCKNKNDFYSFKYMSKILSSSSLSKEYIFSESFESNILEKKVNKLKELKNKYLLKKYLNEILDRKKMHSVTSINKKVPNIDCPKLIYNTEKNIYDGSSKSEIKYSKKKESFRDDLYVKETLKEQLRMNKRNIELYKAPESPKKQDKIPKPLASHLETNSLSHLNKTPSYPFEQFIL
ncbi:conserved Plasmodium protein, unknown function [Plasmodium malariae]|uniref:Uncharacterized protein n=1 Tax=Plasmodium malariae TaxID=5858 RepID=A0A1C3KLA5_PLAMA|nr:conserved Plasmodium protein, unknown function [Plasmodium malariae]